MKVFAKLTHPENGYDHDKESVKSLDKEILYEVKSISMGQSYTTFSIVGIRGGFNSVQFDFYNEHGDEINIYKMPEFNPYLPFETEATNENP